MDERPSTKRDRRRSLRRRSTKPEQLLWTALRNRRANGLKFRRQHSLGPFIVDFACTAEKLVVELDGQYHGDTGDADRRRQNYLEKMGYRVIRFTNEDVLVDVDAVVIAICDVAGGPPHPNPLPHRVAALTEPAQTTAHSGNTTGEMGH